MPLSYINLSPFGDFFPLFLFHVIILWNIILNILFDFKISTLKFVVHGFYIYVLKKYFVNLFDVTILQPSQITTHESPTLLSIFIEIPWQGGVHVCHFAISKSMGQNLLILKWFLCLIAILDSKMIFFTKKNFEIKSINLIAIVLKWVTL